MAGHLAWLAVLLLYVRGANLGLLLYGEVSVMMTKTIDTCKL